MGTSFSLVTVDDQNGRIQRMMLKQYGLDGKCASHRPIGIDANDLYPDKTPESAIYEKAVEVARRCVQEDGAEVIIPGCTLIGSVLTHRADAVESIGAPVVDGMITGFKMAETMAEMQQLANMPPASRTGFFQFPPKADLETLRRCLSRPV